MTLQSPRIYIYKITFEEVPYYYYGIKKEEYYNQEYWGSPKTNKWCWKLYTPKKQILQVFPYTDGGWLEAQEIEKILIGCFYQKDKWCLNESCGGKVSLKILKEAGKKGAQKIQELGIGIYSQTIEEKREAAIKGGKVGGKIGGKIGGKRIYEEKKGIHGRTKDQIIKDGSKGGKISCSQKWMCLETGFVTNAGNLTKYQKAKGIDTSKRERLG